MHGRLRFYAISQSLCVCSSLLKLVLHALRRLRSTRYSCVFLSIFSCAILLSLWSRQLISNQQWLMYELMIPVVNCCWLYRAVYRPLTGKCVKYGDNDKNFSGICTNAELLQLFAFFDLSNFFSAKIFCFSFFLFFPSILGVSF